MTASPITRSSSTIDAAARLVARRSANHTRSPAIADAQPRTRGARTPVANPTVAMRVSAGASRCPLASGGGR
jgi:hypothetical protein